MEISYQWLCEFVDIQHVTPYELAERLTQAGIAVDGVWPRTSGVCQLVVGEVLTVAAHPNADKLHVCTVNVGKPNPLQIVCGAANVAVGQKIPTALVGAVLPGGQISQANLRGVESSGMLCSAQEIGLESRLLPKELTEGLYILPDDVAVGTDVVQLLHLDDWILDLDLTPNRSDCLSIRGVAYEVAAIFNLPVCWPNPPEQTGQGTSPVQIRLQTERCTRYVAQVFTDLVAGVAPLWMQMRLLTMGIRPINRVVDVTNYVMLEWGQPLHAFDLDKVHQHTIVVRQANMGETLVTLDGVSRELGADSIVIADVDRLIGIAGIMGGENSEISSTTHRVVLESAVFDATTVRRTGQRLGLHSEAQQRFEKGIDSAAVRGAMLRAAQLFQQLFGAHCVGELALAGTSGNKDAEKLTLEFQPSACNRLLGTDIPAQAMADVFRRLDFEVSPREDDLWQVRVPTRRPDVELAADLAEEVARLYGYEAVNSTLPIGPTTTGVRTPVQQLRQETKGILVGAGLIEVVTYAFTQPHILSALRLPNESALHNAVPLLRPLSVERSVLRTHLLPSLAEVAVYNRTHGVIGGGVFELASVYWPETLPLTQPPKEIPQWAGLWFGERQASFGQPSRRYDYYDVKGVVEVWLEALGLLSEVKFQTTAAPWYHPGRSAQVVWRDKMLGTFGEVHPETCKGLGLDGGLYAEFRLDVVMETLAEGWRVGPLPRYPAMLRDLAVVVERSVPAAAMVQMAFSATVDVGILSACQVFDEYSGRGIPERYKSLAFALTFRHSERTLREEEVAVVEQTILRVWDAQFGAKLRRDEAGIL
ncbi:phenylalanine--tRNA ligase subunit beta [Alicyclobacillaceae bacterium I2511]|nr:phenylalanine--tRNA ligase subunit beta [Alicyclobacillaceae bacterium I2511]